MTSLIVDSFKTKECDKEVEKDPWSLAEAQDHFKTQEMCNKAVQKDPCSLGEVLDHFKQKKCVKKLSRIVLGI